MTCTTSINVPRIYSLSLILVTPKKYDTKEKGKGVNLNNRTVFHPLSVTTKSRAIKLLWFFKIYFLIVLLSHSLDIKKESTDPNNIAKVISVVAEVNAKRVLANLCSPVISYIYCFFYSNAFE